MDAVISPATSTVSKRRWFQFHLATAVVLSFACGVFMFVNSVPRYDDIPLCHMEDCLGILRNHYGSRTDVWRRYINYGWPMTFRRESGYIVDQPGPTEWSEEWKTPKLPSAKWDDWNHGTAWQEGGIVANCLALVLILIIAGAITEFLLRRREARKV